MHLGSGRCKCPGSHAAQAGFGITAFHDNNVTLLSHQRVYACSVHPPGCTERMQAASLSFNMLASVSTARMTISHLLRQGLADLVREAHEEDAGHQGALLGLQHLQHRTDISDSSCMHHSYILQRSQDIALTHQTPAACITATFCRSDQTYQSPVACITATSCNANKTLH